MQRFVVGDIHGAARALRQVLDRADFDFNDDLLVTLGDICDGWPETKQVVSIFQLCAQVRFVRGNHDEWFMEYMRTKVPKKIWTDQGGASTLKSYADAEGIVTVPEGHVEFFRYSVPYLKLDNMVFVHGGLNPARPVEEQSVDVLLWDRSMVGYAMRSGKQQGPYDKIFVGHTPTNYLAGEDCLTPQTWGNVVAMDTGCGWPGGKLSLMNIDTGEVFQSDMVEDLYPGERGRK